MDLLRRLQGGREACFFDPSAAKVNASLVCHEVRALELEEGEKCFFSTRDQRKSGDSLIAMGELAELKSLELTATVVVKIWASKGEPGYGVPPARPVGEVRIPLQRLVSRCGGSLYHSWLLLEVSGLYDSIASIGSLVGGGDDGDSFEQALMNGPRQLKQPRVCLSLCKTEDLPPSGKVLWSFETPPEARILHWHALLRSQQQHVVMCAAQHIQVHQSTQAQQESRQEVSKRERELEEQVTQLGQDLERIQALRAEKEADLKARRSMIRSQDGRYSDELREREERDQRQLEEIARLQAEVSLEGTRGQDKRLLLQQSCEAQAREIAALKEKRAEAEARAQQRSAQDTQKLEQLLQQTRREVKEARAELDSLSDEANNKIDAANERIKALRRERDEAMRQVEETLAANKRLSEEGEALHTEKEGLTEQKDVLLKIVEDLHKTCEEAGVEAAGRNSVQLRLSAAQRPSGFRFS